jgi:hypothetical protein
MKTLKHIGKMKNTGEKVLVIFRTLPGESNMALVLATSTLPDIYHDALIQLVESEQAQDANEFGEIMFIRRFPDGRSMLSAMQQDNRLKKVATDTVIMTPTLSASIPLDQLNVIIAEQRGVAVGDLASLVNGGTPADRDSVKTPPVVESEKVEEVKTSEVLTDKDLARSYRSQADAMYKEAAKLRKQADDLDPPAKKAAAKSKETESAESAV